MQSSPNPFDFSEYSTSRDGTDSSYTGPRPSWGSETPAFGSGPDPFAPAASATPFATPDSFTSTQAAGALSQGKSPVGWAAAACCAAVVGIVLAVIAVTTGSVEFAVAGWALSGPAAAFVLAKYITTDTKERALPVYQPSKPSQVIYWTAVGFAALGVLLSAWQIADWFGRL